MVGGAWRWLLIVGGVDAFIEIRERKLQQHMYMFLFFAKHSDTREDERNRMRARASDCGNVTMYVCMYRENEIQS